MFCCFFNVVALCNSFSLGTSKVYKTLKVHSPWSPVPHNANKKNVLGLPDKEIEIRDDKLKSP